MSDIKFHPGDECITRFGTRFIATKVRDYKEAGATIDGVCFDGNTVGGEYSSSLKKTGRTFPEVPDLLNKLRANNND